MVKTIQLKESDLRRIVRRVINKSKTVKGTRGRLINEEKNFWGCVNGCIQDNAYLVTDAIVGGGSQEYIFQVYTDMYQGCIGECDHLDGGEIQHAPNKKQRLGPI